MTVTEQYNREAKRVKRYINSLIKEGYTVELDAPPTVKKATVKKLENIKQLTAKEIRKQAYLEHDGKRYTPNEVRKFRRAYEKDDTRFRVDVVESSFNSMMSNFNQRCQSIIYNWVDRTIAQIGREPFWMGVEKGMADGLIMTYEIAYNDDKMTEWILSFSAYFDLGTTENELIEEIVEESFYYD